MPGMDRTGPEKGVSGQYIPTNRSVLAPSFDGIYKSSQHHGRPIGLNDRLEELLVFEILKDGGSEYHRFTVRTLHKYVIHALKSTGKGVDPSAEILAAKKAAAAGLLDKLALGQSAADDATTNKKDSKKEDIKGITYRERLGGFLHPRDMRRLVTPFSASNEPEIIVRRHAILLNFDSLRAIILRDRLLVLVPDGADSILIDLEKRIRGEFDNADRDGLAALDHADTRSNSGGSAIPIPSAQKDKQGKDADSGVDTATASTTELPKEMSDMESEDYRENSPFTKHEQDFPDAFLENEWDELEGKAWIDLPFELQSVDAVLSCVTSMLTDEVMEIQSAANAAIVQLLGGGTNNYEDFAQEVLRQMKNSIKEMTSRVDGFNRALDEVLKDYEEMALMNLSRLLTHPERFIQPVPQSVLDEESDEPELILEAHLQRGHTLNNGLRLIQGQISSSEEYAEGKSSETRNQLLFINLILQTLTVALGFGSYVGALYGMNVVNSHEESHTAFLVIVFGTIAVMIIITAYTLSQIQKVGALPKKLDYDPLTLTPIKTPE
ncbi:hypothetical protein IV203_013886 [Nitzschia inconspicua]|uniref:Magnesium transporter n=1 Tax=Nitzschia inconspicua TaxID=303405 RepID=A0A9K3M9B9_9STRA|nr:hypothetical protein IV203_013886 [Nitzschia inconspicua]